MTYIHGTLHIQTLAAVRAVHLSLAGTNPHDRTQSTIRMSVCTVAVIPIIDREVSLLGVTQLAWIIFALQVTLQTKTSGGEKNRQICL